MSNHVAGPWPTARRQKRDSSRPACTITVRPGAATNRQNGSRCETARESMTAWRSPAATWTRHNSGK